MDKADKQRLWDSLDHSPSINFCDRYVYNPIAYALLLVLVRTRVTPNQITYFWGALMLVCSIGFLFNDCLLNILCGIGWVVAYALDCADGPLARYTGIKSARGDYQDGINHRSTFPLMMFFIGYGAFVGGRAELFGFDIDPMYYLFLGFLAGISMVVIIDAGSVHDRVNPIEGFTANGGSLGIEGEKMKNRSLLKAAMMLNPLAFTNMMVLIPVFAAIDCLDIFIIIYGIAYPVGAFVRYISLLRKIPARKS